MASPKANTVLLLSGYCGTGKDTLFTTISQASVANTSLPQTKSIESLGYLYNF